MNPTIIFDHQKAALLRLVAALFAVVGIADGSKARGPERFSRFVRARVVTILQPAESATRRLIVVLKLLRAMRCKPAHSRSARAMPLDGIPRGTAERLPSFPLIDPRKRFGLGLPRRFMGSVHEPRITAFGWDDHGPERPQPVEPVVTSPDDSLNAAQICRRLLALKAALEDLPKQARRMVRAEAREAARPKHLPGGPRRRVRPEPMRPGLPPGYRRRHRHPVDAVLHECHMLALRVSAAPDTS